MRWYPLYHLHYNHVWDAKFIGGSWLKNVVCVRACVLRAKTYNNNNGAHTIGLFGSNHMNYMKKELSIDLKLASFSALLLPLVSTIYTSMKIFSCTLPNYVNSMRFCVWIHMYNALTFFFAWVLPLLVSIESI